jgi:hypothetical protein
VKLIFVNPLLRIFKYFICNFNEILAITYLVKQNVCYDQSNYCYYEFTLYCLFNNVKLECFLLNQNFNEIKKNEFVRKDIDI